MKGYIIEYSSNNKSPLKRKIGHVLDCKDEMMLIRNHGNCDANWVRVDSYTIIFISTAKPLDIKSIDSFQNCQLVDLLCGTQTNFSIQEQTFSYFHKLLKMLKPLIHIESLSLHGIQKHIHQEFIEKFPSIVQLNIQKCSTIDWIAIKNQPISLLQLSHISTTRTKTLSDILSLSMSNVLRSLTVEHCWAEWDDQLDLTLFQGLYQLSLKNCGMSHVLSKNISNTVGHSHFSSLWIENAPCLRHISPCFIENCDTLHLEDVPLLHEVNLSNTSLQYIHLSNTGFRLTTLPSNMVVQLYLQNQQVDDLFKLLENMKQLETLVLRNWKELTKDMFPSLRKLKTLHIDKAVLPVFQIADCIPSLQHLILSSTQTEYMEDVSTLRRLERITLLFLPLRHLPSGMNQMKELREVTIVNVPLLDIPMNWISCTLLEKFYIEPIQLKENDFLYFSECRKELCQYQEFCIRMIEREKISLPFHLKCSICYSLFRQPSINSSGHTYCKDCVSKWIKVRVTDPQTNLVLRTKYIFPNIAIEMLLQEFLEKHKNLYDPFSKILLNPTETLAINS
jgi:hypothetical protein